MRLLRNSLIVLIMVGLVGFGGSMQVKACHYTSGCQADEDRYTVECKGEKLPGMLSTHVITESNGYTTTCLIMDLVSTHEIKCSGCNYVMRTEGRTCARTHSYQYCVPENNICKK